MPKIEELYAFVSPDMDVPLTDPGQTANPGDEGVMAVRTGQGWMPLVAADRERVEYLRPIAQRVANGTGTSYTLIRLSTREDIETYQGKKPGGG